MSVRTVITLGFGSFGTIPRVVLLGYGGGASVHGPLIFPAASIYRPGMQAGAAYRPGAKQGEIYRPGMMAGEVSG